MEQSHGYLCMCYVCVYMCVCMCVCVYVDVYVCMFGTASLDLMPTWNSPTDICVYMCVCVCARRSVCLHVCVHWMHVYTMVWHHYGVATINRLLKIIGLFCKRALQKRPIFCKETNDLKEPTNHSHPIPLTPHTSHTPYLSSDAYMHSCWYLRGCDMCVHVCVCVFVCVCVCVCV